MRWLRPEVITSYNPSAGDPLTEGNFNQWISLFRAEGKRPQFTKEEAAAIKRLVTKPVKFGTGYPENEKETINPCTIYIVEGGWEQTSKFIGANYWDGRGSSYIAAIGQTTGDTRNMTEPSLLIKIITSLLIAGHNYFVAHHMMNPVIRETPFGVDEENSREKQIAIRTSMMTYEEHRYGVLTDYKVIK
ncbi:MAG: hypothetical protein JSU85_08725 [Candidatus Zixiibacteriota bacterium]|nr:MAG: hypothetical protein JSU85_08725 [candidate division Zixibacteria bacterium]